MGNIFLQMMQKSRSTSSPSDDGSLFALARLAAVFTATEAERLADCLVGVALVALAADCLVALDAWLTARFADFSFNSASIGGEVRTVLRIGLRPPIFDFVSTAHAFKVKKYVCPQQVKFRIHNR